MRKNKSMLCGLLVLALGGCGLTWKCPDTGGQPSPLLSGTYEGDVYDNRNDPFSVTVKKTVVIDREAGTATISFVREGKQVVETWKLSPQE